MEAVHSITSMVIRPSHTSMFKVHTPPWNWMQHTHTHTHIHTHTHSSTQLNMQQYLTNVFVFVLFVCVSERAISYQLIYIMMLTSQTVLNHPVNGSLTLKQVATLTLSAD